jgi:hypothetical protein
MKWGSFAMFLKFHKPASSSLIGQLPLDQCSSSLRSTAILAYISMMSSMMILQTQTFIALPIADVIPIPVSLLKLILFQYPIVVVAVLLSQVHVKQSNVKKEKINLAGMQFQIRRFIALADVMESTQLM